VRALGLPLPSRGIVQVSINLTKPNETAFDPIYEFVSAQAPIAGTELIGVIRKRDLNGATRLSPAAEQVI
jgi:glutamate formiminotransferase